MSEMHLLIVDLDGTIRCPLSDSKFIQHPQDQQIIAGAAASLAHFADAGWQIVAATNQAGVALGKKSLKRCIQEQQYTLELLPLIAEIYFCPDYAGKQCFGVARDRIADYSHHFESGMFRKPNPGMLNLALEKYQPQLALMVGDRPEDKAAAIAAQIEFMDALAWREVYSLI